VPFSGTFGAPAGRYLAGVVALPGFKNVPAPYAAIYDLCTDVQVALASLGAVSPITADTCDITVGGVALNDGGTISDPLYCHTQPAYITEVEPSVAVSDGGTLIAIHGSGFSAADRVFVSGAEAHVVSIAPELIVAITSPAPSGGGVLKVTNSGGCAATLFTVGPLFTRRRGVVRH
jgi:hypothetical protein